MSEGVMAEKGEGLWNSFIEYGTEGEEWNREF